MNRSYFTEFESLYGMDANGLGKREDGGEESRWRCFSREEIAKRGDNLDISWLRDESLQSAADLPEPGVIAGEILGRLEIAIGEMRSLQELLGE